MTTLQIIHGQLEDAAYKITDNFCYSCYHVVEGDHCPTCGSDDFMRHLTGVGVEYGTEWVIDHIIETKLEPVDGEEMFEELLDECYPEIQIGCCTFSPSQVMKELDPVCSASAPRKTSTASHRTANCTSTAATTTASKTSKK